MHLGKGWVGLLAQGSSSRSCLSLISEAGEQSVPSRVKAPRVTSQSSEGGAAACSSPSLPGAGGQSLHFTESLHLENKRRRRDPAEERIVSQSVCPPPSGGSVGLLAARLLLPVLLHSELAIGVLSKPH